MRKEIAVYESNKDILQHDLVDALERGQLIFMLGAGISKELDLPLWGELVQGCIKQAIARGFATPADFADYPSPSATSDYLDIGLLLSKACGPQFHDIVSDELYQKWKGNWNIVRTPATMRALAILMMGSKRGRVQTVINYNFDSLLEWYLLQHGYVVSVVETLPKVFTEGDVTIFHPHGYLPGHSSHGHRSVEITFDALAYARRSDKLHPFNRYVGQLLTTKIFMAVGLSGDDPLVRGALTEACEKAVPGTHPIGFWFYAKGGISAATRVFLKECRVALVEFPDHAATAQYLAEVATLAAGGVLI